MPVNMDPKIMIQNLNHYFGANYPLRPDESYHSTVKHPYRLTHVTDTIKRSKADEEGIRRVAPR